ncbi:hypothetical protein [Streptomyces sp. SYP-A7193]|uniref:hypothetical protein n=1 Tax=Streptomyces sp. SYP-A7193 TaxID=2662065 RepID=UPI0018852539|nr:hypothetical protein [Streptomyces sp. SYP-A7193]
MWLSNTKSRRDKLTAEQLAALAALGMDCAGAVLAVEAAPAQAAPPTALPKRQPWDHHEECDKTHYEGGTCTCDLIERYGPNSERDDY